MGNINMNSPTLVRTKILEEVQLIPENKIEELYDFIHHFRLGLQISEGKPQQIMKFAGCWEDMPEEAFAEFSKEILTRRSQAFLRR
jgi:predicted ATP-dependent Lon-type protease